MKGQTKMTVESEPEHETQIEFPALTNERLKSYIADIKTTNNALVNLIFSSPSVAQSEDGSVRIRPSRGDGNGIDRYSFSIQDKGEIYLSARNDFDKNDNCTIRIGLMTLGVDIGFLRNRHGNEQQDIIDIFSSYLIESFILQIVDEEDILKPAHESPYIRVELSEDF